MKLSRAYAVRLETLGARWRDGRLLPSGQANADHAKASRIAYGSAGYCEIGSIGGEPGSLVGANSVTVPAHRRHLMMSMIPSPGRLVVGTSGSPGSLPALRQAHDLALRSDVLLVAVLAWVPPGGDLAERRWPSAYLRRIWADNARQRLKEALDAAWGGPAGVAIEPVIVRGEPGPALVDIADSADDVLIFGGGDAAR